MNAGQVIELAREWVEERGSQIPGFCGAHLMGGINRMPKDAPFLPFLDIDLNVVSRDVKQEETHDESYKGLILEYGVLPLEDYASPETILASPNLAANFVVPSVLVDPEGILNNLHRAVKRDYARRHWVQMRCQEEISRFTRNLNAALHFGTPIEQILFFTLGAGDLAGLPVVAELKPPTHRRGLILMKEVLDSKGRLDLFERVLGTLGYADLTRTEVESFLNECAAAFDKALEVKQTSFFFDFKVQPHIRPYFVQGAQQMIDDGYYREAMYWLMGWYAGSILVIMKDARPSDQQEFFQRFESVRTRCGYSGDGLQARIRQVKDLVAELSALTDSWIAQNPDIID